MSVAAGSDGSRVGVAAAAATAASEAGAGEYPHAGSGLTARVGAGAIGRGFAGACPFGGDDPNAYAAAAATSPGAPHAGETLRLLCQRPLPLPGLEERLRGRPTLVSLTLNFCWALANEARSALERVPSPEVSSASNCLMNGSTSSHATRSSLVSIPTTTHLVDASAVLVQREDELAIELLLEQVELLERRAPRGAHVVNVGDEHADHRHREQHVHAREAARLLRRHADVAVPHRRRGDEAVVDGGAVAQVGDERDEDSGRRELEHEDEERERQQVLRVVDQRGGAGT